MVPAFLMLAACLDLARPLSDASGPPQYPGHLAIRAGSSFVLVREFSHSANLRALPENIIQIARPAVGSGLTIRALQSGFAVWDPGITGYHPVWFAVMNDGRDYPTLIAHHGVSDVAPENTLSAVGVACELGIPGVEVDVRFTSDSIPVLIHDRDVHRTSNGTGYVDQMTLAQLLRLDFGGWFSSRYAGESIPTLADFLNLVRPCGFELIQLDLKSSAPLALDTAWSRIWAAVNAEGLSRITELGASDLPTVLGAIRGAPSARFVLFANVLSPAMVGAALQARIGTVAVSYNGYGASRQSLTQLDSAGVVIGLFSPPGVLQLDSLQPRPRLVTTDWDWTVVR